MNCLRWIYIFLLNKDEKHDRNANNYDTPFLSMKQIN